MNVDIAQDQVDIILDKARRLRLGPVFEGQRMDAHNISFHEATFDLVVSCAALHHVQHKLEPLKKIRKVLKAGGRLMIADLDMDTTGDHMDLARMKRILDVLDKVYATRPPAYKHMDRAAFRTVFGSAKKHVLNQGDYCISFKQWANLCLEAGFVRVNIKLVPGRECFGIVTATR